MEVPVNYLALIVCTVISVVLGFIWYGPLFGKQWMKLTGIAEPTEKPSFKMMLKPIFLSLVGAVLASYVLLHSITFGNAYLGMSGATSALWAAFYIWLGFIAPPALNYVGWEGKPWKLFFINSGYWFVYLALVGMLLVSWK